MNGKKYTNSNNVDSIEGDEEMTTATIDRYCTVSESLIQSCKEVKLMREGKLPKKTWDELKAEMQSFLKEEDSD